LRTIEAEGIGEQRLGVLENNRGWGCLRRTEAEGFGEHGAEEGV